MNGIKIHIEIGHESTLKAKPTADGFTHDWELFVRSCHSHEISHFIDKVVFNLHDSFAKPKRAIKEPPYVVKESGYAGFEVLIDIYVKSRDEPKKISFQYDMDLQNSGPSICRTQTFSHTFFNPSEEFRRKLVKGGGVTVCNTSMVNNFDEKSRERTNYPTTSGSGISNSAVSTVSGTMGSNGDLVKSSSSGKQHKPPAAREPVNSEFANLFGTPITSLKVSPDPKAHRKTSPNRASVVTGSSAPKGSSSSSSSGGKGEKGGGSSGGTTSSTSKEKSSSRSRHTAGSPTVDRGDRGPREDKAARRERNRSRERESASSRNNTTSGTVPPNNNNTNNTSSSSSNGNTSGSSSNHKEKGQKRRPSSPKYSPSVGSNNKSKSPGRGGGSTDYPSKSTGAALPGNGSASTVASTTGGQKKSSKKEKKDKNHDKDRGAGAAEIAAGTSIVAPGSVDQQSKRDREGNKRDGSSNSKSSRDSGSREEKSGNKKDDKRVEERVQNAATVSSPIDSQRKHKQKKKDKEKGKVQSPSASQLPAVGSGRAMTPTNTFPTTVVSSTSSGKEKKSRDRGATFSSNSPATKLSLSEVKDSAPVLSSSGGGKASGHNHLSDSDDNEQLAELLQPEDNNKAVAARTSKRPDKGEKRKRRGKDESPDGGGIATSPKKMEPPLKLPRKQAPPSDESFANRNGSESCTDSFTGATNSIYGPSTPINHTPEYIQELKLLQHKIMTLRDSNDLQHVVEIIAVTGLYEITEATRTFDFDLCVLSPETVQRLKDFFHMQT